MTSLQKLTLLTIFSSFFLFYADVHPQYSVLTSTSPEFFHDASPDNVKNQLEDGEELTVRKPKSITKK